MRRPVGVKSVLLFSWTRCFSLPSRHCRHPSIRTLDEQCFARCKLGVLGSVLPPENEQIEALSNRPPWTAVMIEQGLPGQPPEKIPSYEGVSPSDDIIAHVMDVGANYWSLWNFHDINAKNLAAYYQAFPKWFDRINRRIGYQVRPSLIWSYEDNGYLGLIVGFANDGIAGVPGVLRITVESGEGQPLKSGCWMPAIRCLAKCGKRSLCYHRGRSGRV